MSEKRHHHWKLSQAKEELLLESVFQKDTHLLSKNLYTLKSSITTEIKCFYKGILLALDTPYLKE